MGGQVQREPESGEAHRRHGRPNEARQGKASEASSSGLQTRHVVDSWGFLWHMASLMLVVAVTSSHLAHPDAPANQRPMMRVGRKARPVSSGSKRHSIRPRALPLQPDGVSLSIEICVATTLLMMNKSFVLYS
jgi:hypothetical protein